MTIQSPAGIWLHALDERTNEEVGVIEKMARSHDNVLGFRVSGDVTREDYEILEPAVQTIVDESGSVRLCWT